MPCIFCEIDPEKIVAKNGLAVAVRDGFPVNRGHVLIVPKRHVRSWFETNDAERKAISDLVDAMKLKLDAELAPGGYNVGFNVGEAAGQTVMHVHVHIIPRFEGDVDDPTGGIRNVIPGKGNYTK